MKMSLYNMDGKKTGSLDAADGWGSVRVSSQAVKDSVVGHLAARRSGTAKAKDRSEVNFTTRKPWKQKGTGRARAGTASSPIWRKGGVVFGPKPRDFSIKLTKKVKKSALKTAMAEKLKNGDIFIVEGSGFSAPKTKEALGWLKNIGCEKNALVVGKDMDRNMYLSLRNIKGVAYLRGSDINVYSLLKHEKIIFEKTAWEEAEKRLLT